MVPLRTAVQIGADEGFELAKATECLHGHKLYTEVWNDQPPLHTYLVTKLLGWVSHSVLVPRLVTSMFTAILLASLFFIGLQVTGLIEAVLMTGLLIVSPGFLELASSCMLEIPSLAMAVAGLCVLVLSARTRWHLGEMASGVLFGLALQIKLISLVWTVLVALVVWLHHCGGTGPIPRPDAKARAAAVEINGFGIVLRNLVSSALSWTCIVRLVVFGVSMVATFILVDIGIEQGAYLAHFDQSWRSHFAATKSLDYGSPAEHAFQWKLLLRNWDSSLLALAGLAACAADMRKRPWLILPPAWLALSLAVFSTHKPWWSYYYIHIALPLCWCAAIGGVSFWTRIVQWRKSPGGKSSKAFLAHKRAFRMIVAGGGLYALLLVCWMGSRAYLQIKNMQALPRTFSSLAIAEAERYKPYTKWMYADNLAYSFHFDIPMPPPLAVVPLKRFWSGDMSNERIAREIACFQPGLVLLGNNNVLVPFQDYLNEHCQLVYQDSLQRLYARKDVIQKTESRTALEDHRRATHLVK
jgi:hypothetical protein